MISLYRIIRISRPRFWHYLLGPWCIGLLLAILSGGTVHHVLMLGFWIFWWLFPANFFIYGVNDVFDYETDRLNPKKQGKEMLLPKSWHKVVLGFVSVFILISILLSTASRELLLAMSAFVFLGLFYSMPPLRFKAKPVVDMASNMLYAVPALHGFFFAYSGTIDMRIFIAGSLWCMAMHAFSAIPDIEYDKKAGISTTATLLGKSLTLLLCSLLYAFAGILIGAHTSVGALGALLYALLCLWIRGANISTDRLRQIYWLFPWLNLLFGTLITLSILSRFVL